jgi:excisionase family DNA binding protein
VAQAAALLGVSRVSIWRWIRAGRLPAARLGHRTTRIRREDLERLLTDAGPDAGASSKSGGASLSIGALLGAEADAKSAPAAAPAGAEHVVQFYETDAYLEEEVARYVADALRPGDAAYHPPTHHRSAASSAW